MSHASPVAPEIAPLLWLGALPPLGSELVASGFEVLVLCNREPYLAPRLFPDVLVLYCPLPDEGGLTEHELRMACKTAETLAGHLVEHGDRGGRVLVACLQGADFVCALTLHVLTGRPGSDCGQIVRRSRVGALTNPWMLEVLRMLPARRALGRGVA